jgi:ribosomal protein L40E
MSRSKEIREKMRKDILEKLKGLSENITDSVGELSKGRSAFVSSETINKRLSICRSCEEFNSSTTQCRRCGCFMSAKTKLKHASCPIEKWAKEL